jgi:hypothetical protein
MMLWFQRDSRVFQTSMTQSKSHWTQGDLSPLPPEVTSSGHISLIHRTSSSTPRVTDTSDNQTQRSHCYVILRSSYLLHRRWTIMYGEQGSKATRVDNKEPHACQGQVTEWKDSSFPPHQLVLNFWSFVPTSLGPACLHPSFSQNHALLPFVLLLHHTLPPQAHSTEAVSPLSLRQWGVRHQSFLWVGAIHFFGIEYRFFVLRFQKLWSH